MKDITVFLTEMLSESKLESKLNENNETIKDEKSFRDYAENKFKEVFGDKLDEKKMKETIDGLLKDNEDVVKAGDWGQMVGMLNKAFGGN
jgi:hypothetical protein